LISIGSCCWARPNSIESGGQAKPNSLGLAAKLDLRGLWSGGNARPNNIGSGCRAKPNSIESCYRVRPNILGSGGKLGPTSLGLVALPDPIALFLAVLGSGGHAKPKSIGSGDQARPNILIPLFFINHYLSSKWVLQSFCFLKNSKFWGHTPLPKKHSYSCWSDLGFGFQQLLEENLDPATQLESIVLCLAAKLDSIAFGIQNRKDNAPKCYSVVHSTNTLYLQCGLQCNESLYTISA